jgi:low affinity Fe/Cu permease
MDVAICAKKSTHRYCTRVFHARIRFRKHDAYIAIAKANHNSRAKTNDERSLFGRVQDAFHIFARKSSNILGSPLAFATAILIIIVWAALGPTFHYSDTWQLIINTGTTIVTFLMVFLIQNTQNRDSKAVHLKLDELIRALAGARNRLVDLEELSDEELENRAGIQANERKGFTCTRGPEEEDFGKIIILLFPPAQPGRFE